MLGDRDRVLLISRRAVEIEGMEKTMEMPWRRTNWTTKRTPGLYWCYMGMRSEWKRKWNGHIVGHSMMGATIGIRARNSYPKVFRV